MSQKSHSKVSHVTARQPLSGVTFSFSLQYPTLYYTMSAPGVDQTGQSPQIWRMLCPEKRQMQNITSPLWHEEEDHLKYIFNTAGTGPAFDAWSKLVRPMLPSDDRPKAVKTVHSPSRNLKTPATELSGLENLSNEILDLVIEHLLPNKSDVIAFGFSSERLWPLVRRHIQHQVLSNAAPWAGKKIAFLGSHSTDLPAPFSENSLVEHIIGGHRSGSLCDARQLFWGEFQAPPKMKDEQLAWRGSAIAHAGKINIPAARWQQLERDISCSRCFPEDQPWILRNLTTRESVSSEKLGGVVTVRSKPCSVQGVAAFSYILLMRTCWTSSPTYGKMSLGIYRGVWAGHCFDIVARRFHESEECLDDWCDVTDVILTETEELKRKLEKKGK